MARIEYTNLALYEKNAHHANDRHDKPLMVLHETVSHDIAGLTDIIETVKFLVAKGYGIHGMSDAEGHKAWALGYATSEFIHAGGVNSVACGIEQVSWIPYLLQHGALTMAQAYQMWIKRDRQLNATAMLVAGWHLAKPKERPLRYVDGTGSHAGVTSHWDVSQHHPESEGHSDCHPHNKGGYYPILSVIEKAKVYAAHDWHF
jgi:hypothetical protein